ncbi:MAG: hypothetical protein K1X51_05815 [Rhodospirillaceae bacterium]|nr:hypothetical protein [Rhodospirillaceae bacterium]
MTTQPLLPFQTSRRNRLFTGVVIAVAGIATAGIAATLQPAKAALEPATFEPEGTLLLPPAIVVASADPAADPNTSGPRGFRGPDRDKAAEQQPQRPQIDKKLTADQVKDIVEGRLAMSGNPNLKVGKVAAKGDGVMAVDVTTKTGALVETQEISTRTGLPAHREGRLGEMRQRFRGGEHAGSHGGPRMMTQRGGPGMDRGEKRGSNGKDLALTTDQAKKLAEAHLIMRGNPHLKVGAVKEKDADTISVDIVAADNSLVSQQLIDRHTGRPQRPSRS